MEHDVPIGARIRYYRRRRGLPQVVCANLVGRSESWLSQVERGVLQVDRVSVLIKLARVLKVELADLLGPALKLPPNGGGPDDLPQGVPAVRRAILHHEALTPVPQGPVDLADLARRVHAARAARYAGRYTELALVLPELITTTRSIAAAKGGDARAAWRLLTYSYDLAADLCYHLGEFQLAWVAADREVAAADRADDELLLALGARRLGYALADIGDLDAGTAVIETAASQLETAVDQATPERAAVFGSLRIATGIAAARREDVAAARHAFDETSRAAALLPDGFVEPWTAFCMTNVGFNDITMWVEAGDPVEALRVTDMVDFDALPVPQRQAGTWVDVARAHVMRRCDPQAVGALLEGERVAPEQVRYDRWAREIVGTMLRRERQSATPGLRGLAQRIGVE